MFGLDLDGTTLILLALTLILLVCILAANIFHKILPRMVERQGQLEEAEFRFREMQQDALELQNRLRELVNQCGRQELERSRIETELRKLQKSDVITPNHVPDFIHEVGEPRAGYRKYTARLSLENPTSYFRTTGEPYNPLWNNNNIAEVWSQDLEEARQMLELSFSIKLGFQKSFSIPTGDDKP